MIIGIVAPYNAKKPAGYERATLGIVQSAIEQGPDNSFIIYTKKGSGFSQVLGDYPNAQVVEIGYGALWKYLGLYGALKADIYLFIGHLAPFNFNKRKFVMYVFDFSYRYLLIPTWKGRLHQWLIHLIAAHSLRHAHSIFALSEATKNDTQQLYGIDDKKINVVYPGMLQVTDVQTEYIKKPQKYFLCVGTIKKRKNTLRVVEAYERLLRDYSGYTLILVGKYDPEKPYVKQIISFIQDKGLQENVLMLGHVSDGQLVALYKDATAVIYPSLLEGFGYPILEAMRLGVPVITSKGGSLEEVAGGAALCVNAQNSADIASAMRRLINEDSLREQLREKGLVRSQFFTWEKNGQIINNCLRDIYTQSW